MASPSWVVQPTANPSGANQVFNDISCVTSTQCVAVGSQLAGSLILIELWNGVAWTAMATSLPSQATAAQLLSVSCTSNTLCLAVGNATRSGSGQSALIEIWDGALWSEQSGATSATTIATLDGISCIATSQCVAVGHSVAPTMPIIERWDGSAWSIEPSPSLSPAAAELTDVSCVATNFCIGVGFANTAGVQRSLVERWNGSAWILANVPAAQNVGMRTVSCVTRLFCIAIDGLSSVRWDGTAWTSVTVPANLVGLRSISCIEIDRCAAAGTLNSGALHTLIASYAVGAFVQVASPDGAAVDNSLQSVDCAPDGTCVAVGTMTPFVGPVVPLALQGSIGVPQQRIVSVSWSAPQDARVQQVATYLGVTPTALHKVAVYMMAFLIALIPSGMTPVGVDQTGTATTYAVTWSATEFEILDVVKAKFSLNDADATRLAVYLLHFLIGLAGH